MAIISVTEEFHGRSSSQELKEFHRTYTRVFLVRATRDQTEYDVINASGLPVPGTDFHPQDTVVICVGLNCQQTELTKEGAKWQVTAKYDSKEQPLQTQADPLSRPVLVEAQYQQINEPVIEDLTSPNPLPVLNSAGEPFESPLERQRALTRYTLTKNYSWATFDTNALDLLVDTCNKNTWWGYDPYACKMDGITWNEKIDQNEHYAEVKYTIVVDLVNLWYPVKVLDRGFREWVGNNPDGTPMMQTIQDSHGVPVTKPQLLNGDGEKLDADADPVYLEFKIYPDVDWSGVPTPP